MQNNRFVVACDIGGSHITSAIVDIGIWSIMEETITRNTINSSENAKTILLSWAMNINDCLSKIDVPINQIGIAIPGPFDYEGGISLMNGQSKYDSLYQVNISRPLLENLSTHLELVRYINDAAAFLQGEVFAQQRSHEDQILGVTLGTGLGSSVWKNGKKAFDADLWNTPYQTSIFEEYLVTRWLIKRFFELTGYQEDGLREILEKYPDHEATKLMLGEYVAHLNDFLTYFSAQYQCKDFIIGGNISKAWNTIIQYYPNAFAGFEIRLAQYHEFAAIIGAASLYV